MPAALGSFIGGIGSTIEQVSPTRGWWWLLGQELLIHGLGAEVGKTVVSYSVWEHLEAAFKQEAIDHDVGGEVPKSGVTGAAPGNVRQSAVQHLVGVDKDPLFYSTGQKTRGTQVDTFTIGGGYLDARMFTYHDLGVKRDRSDKRCPLKELQIEEADLVHAAAPITCLRLLRMTSSSWAALASSR